MKVSLQRGSKRKVFGLIKRSKSSPTTDLIHNAAVQLQHLTIDVTTPRKKDDPHGHLLITPRPPGRHFVSFVLDLFVGHVGLVLLVALLHGHLAREVPGGDTVDPHARLCELLAHHAREMGGGGFRGVVAKV